MCSFFIILVGDYQNQQCTTGSIRLVGMDSTLSFGQGDLQICINNIWGGVGFKSLVYNRIAGDVICRQLGFEVKGQLISAYRPASINHVLFLFFL